MLPLASVAAWLGASVRRGVLARNGVNIADALLTAGWLLAGVAEEANPLFAGDQVLLALLGKVIVVGAASLAVARLAPHMLIWPTAALAVVTVHHLLGGLSSLL